MRANNGVGRKSVPAGIGHWLPLVVGLLLGLAVQTALAAETGGSRVALVVGNSAYASVGRLANPGNDAKLVARSLKAAGFTLIGGDAQLDLDKPHFDAAVAAFGRAIASGEVALFYYSGHGLQVNGTNFLVPVDANPTRPQDLDFQMVSADLVLRQMSESGTKLNILILDACRNNPFDGRGLRSAGGGLAEMKAPEGTLISYATQPGSVARDGVGSDSPYTLALVDALHQPGMDIFRLFNRVGLDVKKATDGQQQPWLSASPIEGEFVFSAPGAAPAPSAPPPAPAPAASAAQAAAPAKTAALEPPVTAAPQMRQGPAAAPEAVPAAGFHCPPKDTVVSIEEQVFDWKDDSVTILRPTGKLSWRSLGSNPARPDVCEQLSRGGIAHRLVGWLDTDNYTYSDEPARLMLGLLQGETSEVVIHSTNKRPPLNGILTLWTTTWKLHGHETLSVAGRGYDTLVFDVSQGSNHNSFTGSGRMWYAPALGLFVRRIWKSSRSDDVVGFSVIRIATPGTAGSAANAENDQ